MPEQSYRAAPEYLEIDHPWVIHKHVPIYEWAFPPKVTDEELAEFIKAREGWAEHAHYPVAWVVDAWLLPRLCPTLTWQFPMLLESRTSFFPRSYVNAL